MSRPAVQATAPGAPAIIGREEARHLLDEALGHSAADQTEVVLESRVEALTRFANNGIHQNVAAADHRLTVRAIEGRRSGMAGTNRLDSISLREVVDQALAMARLSPEDRGLPPLAGPADVVPLDGWSRRTAELSPEARARGVGEALAAVTPGGLGSAGAFTTLARAVAVANSAGRFAHQPETYTHFSITAMGKDSSGWAERHRRDAAALEPGRLGAIAAEKAGRSADPATLEPGRHTVVLEPNAVAELVAFLAWHGLGAQSVQEGRSFMCGRMGQPVTGERITLRDDAYHPLTLGRPFDYEGTPCRAVTLIENGVARAVVHDRRTALKDSVESTGHAIPPPGAEGPLPFNLVLSPGSATLEEMIATTERGVLVTRFWYNRLVDERRTIVTGMTRDGTFLIEDGRVSRGVRNLRYNESVLDVLARAEVIGRDPEPTVFDWVGNCVVAPALKVREFSFSGVTRY
jgi:predicted Zn-dependent protease